jgi:hypothetical protein
MLNMRSPIASICTLATLAFSACDGSHPTGSEALASPSYITNASFEIDSLPSLAGWKYIAQDTSHPIFSTDVPPGGGLYSLSMRNGWVAPSYAYWYIIPMPGKHRYRMSVFAKASPTSPPYLSRGEVILYRRQPGELEVRKSVSFSDSTWTNIIFLDTLSSTLCDTLIVGLAGSHFQWASGNALFDLCRFERLD